MDTLKETTGQGQLTPQQEARLLVLAMQAEAVAVMGCGQCGAVVQEWLGPVQVILMTVDLRCVVWMIGIPSEGKFLMTTDNSATAQAIIAGHIVELSKSEIVEAEAFAEVAVR